MFYFEKYAIIKKHALWQLSENEIQGEKRWKKWNITKETKLLPVIFALAWPTMLEQFLQTAVQYIDTAMVGSLGTQATAAVGSTSTVNC